MNEVYIAVIGGLAAIITAIGGLITGVKISGAKAKGELAEAKKTLAEADAIATGASSTRLESDLRVLRGIIDQQSETIEGQDSFIKGLIVRVEKLESDRQKHIDEREVTKAQIETLQDRVGYLEGELRTRDLRIEALLIEIRNLKDKTKAL